MKEQFEIQVLICGAGAAGLALSIELARRGIPFRLIEKARQPFNGSRGKGIQPRTQEIFEDMGILDRIVAMGGVYPSERRYREDGSFTDADVVEHNPPTPAEPHLLPLMVPQWLTESVMRERLMELGHWPEFGCELTGLEQDSEGVSATLVGQSGEQTLRVRWLVGADGGRSFVRHALGIGFPGKTLGVRAIVADVVATGLSRDRWHRFGAADMQRQVSLCPLAGTEFFQIQGSIALDEDVSLDPPGLTQWLAQRTACDDIRVHSVSWASAYTMNARLADRYRVEHAFLIGDAAHIHPPTGGQGLNTSVQDAYNLGWKLAAVINGKPDTLLDSYEQERRPVAAAMLGLSTKLLDALQRGDTRRGRDVQQLDIGYRESMLLLDRCQRLRNPLAGDRAPDAPMRGAAATPRRLFDLLKGDHWTLLGYGTQRGEIPPRPGLHIHLIGADGDIQDDQGHFKDAYHPANGDWVLVRPDGYIAAFVPDRDIEALENYLDQVGLTRPMLCVPPQT
jgi:2-polyprenyl-6-methoxyphenol hydroxylase-like FAD-dependent oxidoreductase